MSGRTAIVLFNLGGPDSLDAVEPFLRNLFSDPAILRVPQPFRSIIANLIAGARAPLAREIFAELSGRSPLLAETEAQAQALGRALGDAQMRVFIAMRYWHPRADDVAEEVVKFAPERVVFLPLYPQFSTTTTASSIREFESALKKAGFGGEIARICCYPAALGLVEAVADRLRPALDEARQLGSPQILFSAHGLPESIVRNGDPYVFQVRASADAIIAALGDPKPDWLICYQSRVGPLRWTRPSIDEAIAAAAAAKRSLVVVPIAFVSEHSETLVELDIKYREIALKAGASGYIRLPAVGVAPPFIGALADLVREAESSDTGRPYCNTRICPRGFSSCPNHP
jgi:protoporphyrin/coproporphyrin ferrochelatase